MIPTIALPTAPSTGAIRDAVKDITAPYFLLAVRPTKVTTDYGMFERAVCIAQTLNADWLYCDYRKVLNGKTENHPTIEYQKGSLRDDFDFGALVLCKTSTINKVLRMMDASLKQAAIYELRLRVSEVGNIVHLPETLYTEEESDTRKSGEQQFDYVNPRNREVQIEMEQVCTAYLKRIGATLTPPFVEPYFDIEEFDTEASVIIPVFNREKTIAEAIHSVLTQECEFKFNVIIVDNHSTDGTTNIIKELACNDNRIVHIIPQENNLGIGGCWDLAVKHSKCGKFAMQLDSDDLYIDNGVISRIVNGFRKQHCAMLIGSYKMVNFKLEEIPPGIIDHKEWSDNNGMNNALRINGLGAPRAFFTPVIRSIGFPNVSYGEDYAVGLAISRTYKIGRIYEPLYLCRRWEGNSDSSLPIDKLNRFNTYKDFIRTLEVQTRIER